MDKIRDRIALCQWGWVIIDVLVFAALMLFALFLGARGYQVAVQHRLVAEGRRAPPPVDVLVLPVSKPKRNEQSHFCPNKLAKVVKLAEKDEGVIKEAHDGGAALDGAAVGLELFTCPRLRIGGNDPGDYFSAFSWTTGFKTIDFFLKSSKARLRAIHLVPSSETAGDADAYYRAAIKALIADRIEPRWVCDKINKENWKDTKVSERRFDLIVHDGVKYESFEDVQKKIRHIVDDETKRQGHAPCDIAIDVTGGGSAFSGAAAIESTSEHVIYSYVPPLDDEMNAETLNDPLAYNVVATSVSAG